MLCIASDRSGFDRERDFETFGPELGVGVVTSDEYDSRRQCVFTSLISGDPPWKMVENRPQMEFGLGNGVSFQARPQKTVVLENEGDDTLRRRGCPVISTPRAHGPVCPMLEVMVGPSTGGVARAFRRVPTPTRGYATVALIVRERGGQENDWVGTQHPVGLRGRGTPGGMCVRFWIIEVCLLDASIICACVPR